MLFFCRCIATPGRSRERSLSLVERPAPDSQRDREVQIHANNLGRIVAPVDNSQLVPALFIPYT